MTPAPSVHVVRFAIGWGHCDPAGLVYFPRFFELFHNTMEDWFGSCLGVAYRDVIVGRQLGFPAVHTHADFREPTRFGESVDVELRLAGIGRTSIRLEYGVRGVPHAGLRIVGQTVCAVMDLDPEGATYGRAIPLPDDLRARMETFAARGSGSGSGSGVAR